MKILRNTLKHIAPLKLAVLYARTLHDRRSRLARTVLFRNFLKDYRAYRALAPNTHFKLSTADLYPRIYDKTATTPLDPVYFYQDTWCARKVFEKKPERHVDVGSKADLIGILSQFVPTTMVDIRPLPLALPELSFVEGSLLALPFKDNSIESLSSICVIEHIGLGRYGDPLDPFGSEKSFAELIRVLAPGGDLYISVPVDDVDRVYFNAHRAFTRDYVLELAGALELVEERYIYGDHMEDAYAPKNGFGTGLYHFKKQ